jgi:hypothetical protein
MFVATTVVGALIAPHAVGPQPSALGDFSVPTAEEGRAIPVVFGTCMIRGGNTVWWGDLKSQAINPPTNVMGAIFSFGASLLSTQIIGYKYFLGCQFMLCRGPVDALVQIEADQKDIPITTEVITNGDGSENYIQVTASGPNLFGGTAPGGGGGISGIIAFYRGLQTQQPDDYLSAKQGRIVTDQSGIGSDFHGVGNGLITSLSAGSGSLDETFTITAIGIDANVLHATFQKMKFSVVGSVSGAQSNTTENSDASYACWADQAFSCSKINVLIATGSTQFAPGDTFTIVTQHSHVASAYRGNCYMVFRQLYVGTSNYLKPLAPVVRRCPDPLAQGSSIANIAGDANPALCVYECLTDVDYGLGIPAARMDAASFEAAAVTLAGEGLGISMQFDTQASADNLIGELLRHCDGLVYTDPQTGLWTIVLARGGYDPTTLPVLTVDNVLATPDFSRGSWEETSNLLTIRYASREANFTDRTIRAYDPANIAVTQEVRSQSFDFKGLSSEASAALVAMRVLKTLTYPLAKMKLIANRTAWQYRPGGLFRFTWVPLGVVDQVFRITRISYGELTDGKISIDAVEDIFGINSVAFVAPPPSGWVNPAGLATPCSAEQLVELPYALCYGATLPIGIYALAMAARDPAVYEKSFEIWVNPGAGFVDSGRMSSFCPVGVLNAAYAASGPAFDSTGFVLSAASGVDLDSLEAAAATEYAAGANLCMIDNEILAWTTPTLNSDGTYSIAGVARGLLDTVPADHASGAEVFFFSLGMQVTEQAPYPVDLTVTARFTPNTSIDQLDVATASDVTLTTRSRFLRPYPPGNISVNGHAYGVRPASVPGDFTVSWSSRNRLTQALTVQQDATDVTGEVGQFFTVQRLIAGVAVGAPVNVGAAETFTYTAAQRGIDDPDFTKLTTLEVYSNVGALSSYFAQVISTKMFGTTTTLPSPGRYEFSATEVGGLLL